MVTFVTLFLALVTGIHPVEVAVDGPVDRVEILLNERPVGELDGPPWRLHCNFGDRLTAHELVAVAYDAAGNELHRTRQLVNLPRPMAETRIAFETDDNGEPAALRVFSESTEPVEPLSVYAMFDGRALRPDEQGRFPLPRYDPDRVHIVSAEATFLDGLTARSDVTFGGRYGSQVTTELTAVPIVVEADLPSAEDLQGAFMARGRTLRLAAVEQPGIQLFQVRDHASLHRLSHLRARQDKMAPFTRQRQAELMSPELTAADDRLHVVVPNPTLRRGRELFPTAGPIDLERWRLPWLATHLTSPAARPVGQKLAAAVAVSAVRAAADGSPRAVILIVTGDPRDESEHTAGEVRSYLRELRVPLYVWSTGGPVPAGWGEGVDISSQGGLRKAARSVRRDVGRQWIVWVEGNHMINEIELVRDLEGVRLAGVN